MKTIIFSKNRACQLELLLRTLDLPAIIIYKTTNDEFQQGYDLLIKEYSNFQFIKQIIFKEQVISNLEDYFMFLCDDDFMIESFDCNGKDFQQFKENTKILCLSLRLAPYFPRAPEMVNNTWIWRRYRHSWGYPMSVSATIFRKSDLLPIMVDADFDDPSDLEVILRAGSYVPNKELMSCCDTPKIINNLANQVQTKYRFRNLKIPLDYLNKQFLSGKRISLEYMRQQAKGATNCFIMVDYKYE